MSATASPPAATPRRDTPRVALASLTQRPVVQTLLATLVYAGFAVFLTWPMVTDMNHVFYGAAGDAYGTIAFFRELVQHHLDPFVAGRIADFEAPAGQPVPWIHDVASFPSVGSLYLLSAAFGSFAAVGLYTLAGYILTGTAMFLLARKLTGSAWIGLIAGWALAFYPFAVLNGQGHYDYIHAWVFVLALWRLLELSDRPTVRNGIVAGLAVALCMSWTAYFILFGGLLYLGVTAAVLVIAARRHELRDQLKGQLAAAVVVAVFVAVLGVLALQGNTETQGLRANSAAQFNTYSARAYEYVIPPATNPWFGPHTAPYLNAHIHGSSPGETTLYVGISVILLALVALGAAFRRKLPPHLRRVALIVAAATLLALATSGPPQVIVAGHLVPLPSYFITKVTTTWRVYSRLVVVVMLGLTILAALGLAALTARRSPRARIAILLAASLVIPLDLYARLGGRTNTIQTPAIYATLKKQPPGVVAEYPLIPAGYGTYNELFFQQAHGNPILNGYPEGSSDERRALSLAQVSNPFTAPRLAALGVKYVLVRREAPGYGLAGPGRPTRQYQLIGADSYARLYRVAPARNSVGIATSQGFAPTEKDALGTFNWLLKPRGTLDLEGICAVCRGTVSLTLKSFHRPRIVTILGPDGRTLARRRITGAATHLRLPVSFRRRASLTIVTSPGPDAIAKVTPSPDPRSVSIQVYNPGYRPRPARRKSA